MLSCGSGSTCAKLASQSEVTAAISLPTSKHDEGVIISNHFASLWESSDRAERYKAQLLDFMEAHVHPFAVLAASAQAMVSPVGTIQDT
jgi:hypothetical protein